MMLHRGTQQRLIVMKLRFQLNTHLFSSIYGVMPRLTTYISILLSGRPQWNLHINPHKVNYKKR